MTGYQPGVDAVVVNYKTPKDLEDFLASWQEHAPTVPWDLWVVNIEPTAEDGAVARQWAEKLGDHVHLVEYGFNCGYAHAVNNASTTGRRETFVAFNADVVLSEGAVDECHWALLEHPEWAVLGPRQVNGHGKITHAGIFGTLAKPQHRGWQARDEDSRFTDVAENAITVSGSAYFIKRAVWDQLRDCPKYREAIPSTAGAFLPTQLFYEETWCSVHAISHGYRVAYYGPVTITHRWHRAVEAAGLEAWAANVAKESHELYRSACDTHGIPHD